MHQSSDSNEEVTTKEQVDNTKGTDGANQVEDNNNNTNNKYDMPTLQALIRRIVKRGRSQ